MGALIEIQNLIREYMIGGETIRALDGINLTIHHGEFVAIMGPSGSGKSTAMNMIGCLDTPSSGRYVIDGFDVSSLSEDQLAELRNQKIGFVFQNFNLLSKTTALENVELPMMYAGVPARIRRQRAMEALARVGLSDRMHNRPNELSGGQQQRVSIARALVNNPVLILADEPTGALDSRTTADILALFEELHEQGNTIVIVTHEDDVGHHAKRIIRFRDGKVESDVQNLNRLHGPGDQENSGSQGNRNGQGNPAGSENLHSGSLTRSKESIAGQEESPAELVGKEPMHNHAD